MNNHAAEISLKRSTSVVDMYSSTSQTSGVMSGQQSRVTGALPKPQSDKVRSASSSRASLTPAEAPQRNRFGFGFASSSSSSSTAKPRLSLSADSSTIPMRPASSLGSHLPIPAAQNRRRSSSVSALPVTTLKPLTDSPRIVQLERDFVKSATDLETAKSKLLIMENQILAIEQDHRSVVTSLAEELTAAREETSLLKIDLVRTHDEMMVEAEQKLQEFDESNLELAREMDRMRSGLDRKELDLDRSEAMREQLEEQLRTVEGEKVEIQEKNSELVASILSEKLEAERELIVVREELRSRVVEESTLEKLEVALNDAHRLAEEAQSNNAHEIATLREEKCDVESSLLEAREELKVERMKEGTRSSDEAEMERLVNQLSSLEAELAEIKSSSAASSQLQLQIAGLETKIEELEQSAKDSERTIIELKEVVESSEATGIAASKEIVTLQSVVEQNDEESAKLRSDYDVLQSQVVESASTVEALEEELATLRDSLSSYQSELEPLSSQLSSSSSAHISEISTLVSDIVRLTEELASALAAATELTTEKLHLDSSLLAAIKQQEQLTTLLATSAVTIASLEQSLLDLSSSSGSLEELDSKNQQLLIAEGSLAATCQQLSSLRSDAASSLDLSQQRIVELEASLHEFENRPIRSFDDVEVQQLRENLVMAEQVTVGLRGEIVELTNLEWGAKAEKVDAEERIAQLVQQIDTLDSRIVDLTTAGLRADVEIVGLRESVEAAESRVEATEDRLASDSAAMQELEKAHDELKLRASDWELSVQRVEIVEENLNSTMATLESLRVSSEEAAFVALQGSRALEDQVIGRDESLLRLEQKIMGLEEIKSKLEQKIMGLEEAARISIDSHLHTDDSMTQLQSVSSALHLELDTANLQIVKLNDTIATLESTPAVSLPPTFAEPSSSSIVLVQRLREERDDLIHQLDFVQTESRFKHAHLVDRLQEANALALMERTELTKGLAEQIEARRLSDETARVELEDSESHRRGVEMELQRERLVASEARAQLLSLAHDGEELALEYDALTEKMESVKTELATNVSTIVILKEQLEESEIILTEMESERDELEGQLEATFEENHQHSLDLEALTASLAIANEQVQESEAALSAARDAALVLWADVSIDPLVESLQTERDSLRGEIVELEARVLRRTVQIGLHEQTIAVLQSRAMIETEEDCDETALITDTISSNLADATLTAMSASQHAEVLLVREKLEEDVRMLTTQLEGVQKELHSMREDSNALGLELSVAQEEVRRLSAELAVSQQLIDSASASLSEDHAAFDLSCTRLAELHATHDHLLSSVESLTSERDAAVESIRVLNVQLCEERSALAQLTLLHIETQSNLASSEESVRDLNAIVIDTQQNQQQLDTAQDAIATLQMQLDIEVQANSELSAEAERLDQAVASLEADLAESSNDAERIATLESDLSTIQAQHDVVITEWQSRQSEMERSIVEAERVLGEKELALLALQDELLAMSGGVELSSSRIEVVETELRQAREQCDQTNEVLKSERSRSTAELEARGREVQTLRKLAKEASTKSESLMLENSALEADLLNATKELDQVQLENADLGERFDELSQHYRQLEEEREAAYSQIASLEQDLATLESKLAEMSSDTGMEAKVAELEKRLVSKTNEMENTDERYLEVLRTQKRHLTQIERLKVKVEGLQRALIAATAQPQPVTPAPARVSDVAVVPASTGNKRKSPTEFDPPTSTTPRAVVATLKRVSSSKGLVGGDENAPKLKSVTPGKYREDDIVPLKAAALSPVKKRVPLSAVSSTNLVAVKSSSELLKARVAGLRTGRRELV